jgi:hypothetical protein
MEQEGVGGCNKIEKETEQEGGGAGIKKFS